MLMAMGPERSKPLHNFTMPCLKWANQKFLRCTTKVNFGGNVSVNNRRSPGSKLENSPVIRSGLSVESEEKSVLKVSKSKSESDDGEEGIEAVREKLMFDLKTAAEEMIDAILRDDVRKEQPVPVVEDERPWNLWTRREAACKTTPIGRVEGRRMNCSPMRSECAKSPPVLRREKNERKKFTVSLPRKEMEEDYKAMTGEKLPRRPKKRGRIMQNELDSLFPGLWLREITADRYKVAEFPENGKPYCNRKVIRIRRN